ncbi:MAG: carbohydrate porin [Gammaproteobacteria bacterium]
MNPVKGALAAALLVVNVHAAEEESEPFAGDLREREQLLGDPGGIRSALAEMGLELSIDMTQVYQGIVDGGRDEQDDYQGAVDYFLGLDTGEAGLWSGGHLEVHAESYFGDAVFDTDGALLPSNFSAAVNEGAGNSTYVSHITYSQEINERWEIVGGKIDTSTIDANAYAHGDGNGRIKFMNAAFNLNPVVLYTSPYSTLGGGVVYRGGDAAQHEFTFHVYDTDGEIEKIDFDSLFEDNTTYAGSARLATNFFGKPGHHYFGVLYGDGEFDSLEQDARIRVSSEGSLELTITRPVEDSTWAFVYNFDQTLVENEGGGWGLFGRYGVADEDTNLAHQFFSIGVGGSGLLPGRPQDSFGVGYFFLDLSDEVDLLPVGDDEQGIEAYYKLVLVPSVHVTADLQWLDGAVRGADDAVLAGLRLTVMF